MHVVARRGLDGVAALTTPLLAVSFVCLLAVKVPGLGVTVNGARRWLGAGPLQFQPSEIAKLALVLYGAMVLAQRPGRIRSPHDVMPLLLVAGTALLLIASQPDLGTALVIALHASPRCSSRRACRSATSRSARARAALLDPPVRAARALPPRAPDVVPRPVGARGRRGLPGRPGPDRARLRRALRPRPRPVGPEDLLPARGPHRLHPRGHRRGARRGGDLRRCCSSTA